MSAQSGVQFCTSEDPRLSEKRGTNRFRRCGGVFASNHINQQLVLEFAGAQPLSATLLILLLPLEHSVHDADDRECREVLIGGTSTGFGYLGVKISMKL